MTKIIMKMKVTKFRKIIIKNKIMRKIKVKNKMKIQTRLKKMKQNKSRKVKNHKYIIIFNINLYKAKKIFIFKS